VEVAPEDFFAEILHWARTHPEAASVVQAEQLELPGALERPAPPASDGRVVDEVLSRLELLRASGPSAPAAMPGHQAEIRLSFTQLHQFELCPVRYRFQEVWAVPAPPDELRPGPARVGTGAAEMGSSVHRALASWHWQRQGGASIGDRQAADLLAHYEGPTEGQALLRAYQEHPLAAASTLGVEVEFNLLLGEGVRVKGLVDRICRLDGRTVLVDYKTNARLDARLREVYAGQLQLYGLAARRGLLPGGPDPSLVLFDLRQGKAIEVARDDEGAERRVIKAANRIAAGDFQLGVEHAGRPCFLCAYRPLCADRRR
jgi:PD-(D/E)XK nuclease superfamily